MENTEQTQDCRRWKDDDYLLSVPTELNKLRKKKKFCDFTVKIGSQKFAAHRCVLNCLSPYFKALLDNQFAELVQNEIEIEGFDAEIFELILNYAYTGSVTFTNLNAIPLLIASDYFQVLKIKNAVALFLEESGVESCRVDDSNCFKLYCLADMLHCLNLIEICKSYILRDFAKLCKQPAIFSLSTELLINLISSDDLMLDEEAVLDSVYHWLSFDIDNRMEEFVKVFEVVRWGLLNPYFLVIKLPEKYPAISNCKEVLPLIRETWQSLSLRKINKTIPNLKNKPRKMVFLRAGSAIMENVIWFCRERSLIVSECNLRLNRFKDLKRMLIIRTVPGLTYVNGCLYAVGGQTYTWCIERYNFNTEVWNVVKLTKKTYTEQEYSDYSIVAVKNKLYVKDSALTYLYVIELENLSMHTTKENPFTRIRGELVALCAIDSDIYVIGGCMNEVERYNVDTGAWDSVPPMLLTRFFPAVAVRGGKIYVGGRHENIVEVYDPFCNFWSVCDYPYTVEYYF